MKGRSAAALRLIRSLQVTRQRALLDSIGERVGTPVVYLKSAWADPVLYGGRGDRWGSDLDILVERRARMNFARELTRHGFRPDRMLAHHMLRGWQIRPPAGAICVDLHAGIGEPPWFPIDSVSLFQRSRVWDSVDGPILGLSIEDQVVHAVAHYASDRFSLDARHLGDIVRLLERYPVDWVAVAETCARSHLRLALYIFAKMLRRRGASVPDTGISNSERVRLAMLERLFFSGDGARRFYAENHTANIRVDLLFFLPLLSPRITALPRLMTSAVVARLRQDVIVAGSSSRGDRRIPD